MDNSGMIHERIKYIDALRGFTMLLVVFCHVESIGFRINPYDSVVGNILVSFRMPMFFFISGYIAYKSTIIWDKETYGRNMRKKAMVQLIPTFFFFSLFTLSHHGNPVSSFLNGGLGGYWFTLVLFEMFVLYYTLSFFCLKSLDWCLVGLSVFGIFSLIFFRNDSSWWNVLCLENLCKYFQFFTFGVLAKKYNEKFVAVVKNDMVRAVFILCFIVCIMLISVTSIIDTYIGKSVVQDMLIRYFGLVSVFCFFMNKEKYFANSGGRYLCFIGRRTLDVYLIHYFLLPHLPILGDFAQQNAIVEIVMTLLITLCVVALSLLISEFIRTSEFLAHYLFGVRSNKYKI